LFLVWSFYKPLSFAVSLDRLILIELIARPNVEVVASDHHTGKELEKSPEKVFIHASLCARIQYPGRDWKYLIQLLNKMPF